MTPPPFVEKILAQACRIQQIPGPTFHESSRAEYLRGCFSSEKHVDSIDCDDVGNVLVLVKGSQAVSPLVVSAHLDTVFPLDTDLTIFRSQDSIRAPGIGDNALGVAALLGLLWLLSDRRIQLPGDLWLVGNVGEEGLGNLRGMRAIVDRFGSRPAAYIIVEGLGLGEVFHRGLGVRRFKVAFQTGGGHSWIDAGQPSAVHEAARLVTSLASLPLPAAPRSSLNIGVIKGGTSVNTIAASASFELDLRSEEPAGLEHLWTQVERLIASSKKKGVQVDWQGIGTRPAGGLPVDHPLVNLALDCLHNQGIQGKPGIGSTDANLPLSLGYPAVSIGLTRGSGAHSSSESIETRPLESGMQALLELVTRAYTSLPNR